MIAAGIDIGTSTTEVFFLKDGNPFGKIYFPTSELVNNLDWLCNELKKFKTDVIACAFGYGLPVKKLNEITDLDIFLMTLNFDEKVFGVREFLRYFRNKDFNMYVLPGVIHLPTVPIQRKINKIDLGTPDKLASTALAIFELSKHIRINKQNFILVEAGSGFNAVIGVKGGKIVDGVGGSSGFPSLKCSGCLDGELAYILQGFKKSLLSNSGILSFFNLNDVELKKIPRRILGWITEYILKCVKMLETTVNPNYVVVSGQLFNNSIFYKKVKTKLEKFGHKVKKLEGFGVAKQSAEGAAIIANGLAKGKYRKIVKQLRILEAKGTCLDYLSPSFKLLIKDRVQNMLNLNVDFLL